MPPTLSLQLSSRTSGSTIPRNDFCRLFAKAGLLRRLIALADHAQSSLGEAECAMAGVRAGQLVKQVVEVLLTFSHGDPKVKHALAETNILKGVVRALTNAKAKAWKQGSASGGGGASSGDGDGRDNVEIIKKLLQCVKNPSPCRPLPSAP